MTTATAVASLEDKVVQRAVVEVLSTVYEQGRRTSVANQHHEEPASRAGRRHRSRLGPGRPLGGEDPVYYLVPGWWMQNDIYTVHEQYLEEHGGQRAKSPDSTHHAIAITRVEKWRERWDVLGIF